MKLFFQKKIAESLLSTIFFQMSSRAGRLPSAPGSVAQIQDSVLAEKPPRFLMKRNRHVN
jgi:hypothetical protein